MKPTFIVGAALLMASPYLIQKNDLKSFHRSPASIEKVTKVEFKTHEELKKYLEELPEEVRMLRTLANSIKEIKDVSEKKELRNEIEKKILLIKRNINHSDINKIKMKDAERVEINAILAGTNRDLDYFLVDLPIVEEAKKTQEEKQAVASSKVCNKKSDPLRELALQFDKILKDNKDVLLQGNLSPQIPKQLNTMNINPFTMFSQQLFFMQLMQQNMMNMYRMAPLQAPQNRGPSSDVLPRGFNFDQSVKSQMPPSQELERAKQGIYREIPSIKRESIKVETLDFRN